MGEVKAIPSLSPPASPFLLPRLSPDLVVQDHLQHGFTLPWGKTEEESSQEGASEKNGNLRPYNHQTIHNPTRKSCLPFLSTGLFLARLSCFTPRSG